MQVHPAEKALPLLEQGVGLGQKAADQRPRGRIAGVDDQRDLLNFFALPRLHRLDQGHIAVDRKAVGVKVQVEGVGVEVRFLPQHAEPAQKIPVAAPAAVGRLDRLGQVSPFGAGLLGVQLQLRLHPPADLLPGGLRLGRGRVLLAGSRPQTVVVGAEFPLQLLLDAGRQPPQPAVGRGGGRHMAAGGQRLIGAAADVGQRPGHAFAPQPVDHVFHRDVAGQMPQRRVPAALHPQMPEHTVEHRVQIQPAEILRVLPVEPQQGAGLIVKVHPVGGQHPAPLVGHGGQGPQRLIEEAELKVQPAAQDGQHLAAHPRLPFLVGLGPRRLEGRVKVNGRFPHHRPPSFFS